MATKSGSLADKFRKQKADLLKRHQEQVDTKDQGNEFPTIFDKDKIPKGLGFWNCKKGEHLIDIIPFFAGSQHPKVKEGELAYVVDLYVHMNVGPLRTPYPCTAKNFKEVDPICEYIAKNRLDKEEWKRVSSKRRTAYLVWVHDSPEEEKKGLQIWEVAHYFFEQHIDEIAKSPRGGGAEAFSDIESGKSIWFNVKVTGKYKDASGTDQDSIGFVGHKFVDRVKPYADVIPEHILKQTFPLDEAIRMRPSYDEVMEAFVGPKLKPKSKYAEESEDEKENLEFDNDEDEVPSKDQKVKKGRKKPEPEPEEDEEEESEDEPEDDEEDNEEADEEIEDEESEEDEDDNEDSEDEEPEEITECPHDPKSFGEVDEHEECEADGGCPLWDACSDEAAKRAKAAKAQKPKDKKPTASSDKKKKLGKK